MCAYHESCLKMHQALLMSERAVSLGAAYLQRIFIIRMGSHMLPIDQGRHLQLRRRRHVS